MTETELDAHRVWIEGWVGGALDPYLEKLADRRGPTRPKEFNDAVWGTLQLSPAEIVVLDSPVLQRLRRIRQLGVVHLVYPGATHTRLEHSLGVVHQVQRLVTTLNDRGCVNEPDRIVVSDKIQTVLRLAALCHDVGHGAMSHVSEYAFDDDPECKRVLTQFQRQLKRPAKSQLSELAAYFIAGSPAFGKLLQEALRLGGQAEIPDVAEMIQKIIVGSPIDKGLILAHELISGPFDADKLDYLPRDALMCGVPTITDIPRLIQKVRATHLGPEGLTPRLKRFVDQHEPGYTVTGIARSGGRTLDELALARTLMFDKVYRHQKVRAAEGMVFTLLTNLAHLRGGPPATVPLELFDDELISMTEPALLAKYGGAEMNKERRARIAVVADLAQRIRERRIFARAFAFAAIMTDDGYRHDPLHSAGLKRLLSDARNRKDEVVQRLADELGRMSDHLGDDGLFVVPGGDLRQYLQVSAPKPAPQTASADTGHAHLIDDHGALTQVQEDAAETLPWSDAYVATRDLGHVFCPAEIADHLFVAACVVVRRDYDVHIPTSMTVYAKRDPARIAQLRRDLDAVGYYEGLPADLRPEPAVLRNVGMQDRIGGVVRHFAGYAGPSAVDGSGRLETPKAVVTRERIVSFLKQFRDDELIDRALIALEHVRVLGRSDVADTIRHFVDDHPGFRGARICPLGDPKDSASMIAYFAQDVADQYDLVTGTVGDALSVADVPLIFIDDFIGRGSQSIDIVEVLLGAPRSTALGETRTTVLVEPLRAELRKRQVAFVFVAGTDEGAAALERRASELQLSATVFRHIAEGDLPSLTSALPNDDVTDQFVEFCRSRGGELLTKHAGRAREADWIQPRALGYGNRGLLVTTEYNTPTMTVTCFWAGGHDSEWTAILPRRSKA